ncbi:18779_t:CDS:2, partial [Gigaspora rosea]
EIEDANEILDCNQQSAEMENVSIMNDLDRHDRDKKKCCNKPDNDENCTVEMDNCWWDDLESEVDRLLLVIRDGVNCRYMVDVTWKRKVDNSIRILLFWMNLMSVILNSYLRQVDGQLNKTNEYVKVVEGGTRTIDIDDVQRKQKAVGNEVSKVDFDHEIPALEKLSESENYVVDDEFLQSNSKDNSVMKHQMHKQRTTVKSGLICGKNNVEYCDVYDNIRYHDGTQYR